MPDSSNLDLTFKGDQATIQTHTSCSTARMLDNAHCRNCDWPVVFVCCNGQREPHSKWDWWMYCSNPACNHHSGDGVAQDDPSWVERE